MSYLTKYPAVNNVLDFLMKQIKAILAEKLCGVYLYGSLASGDFEENISDIDLMIIINEALTNPEFETLKQMHTDCATQLHEWDNRLEIAYITTDTLKTFRDKENIIAIISPGEPFHTKTAGLDWMINFYLIREQCEVLFGPEPSSLIALISQDEYIKAVSDQLREWEQWVETSQTKGFQAYAILTMCRGFYAICFGEQISKLKAARWAAGQYKEWAELIQTATKWRSNLLAEGQAEDNIMYLETGRFVRWINHMITKKELLDKLEAVYQQFLGIKVLFETQIPEEQYTHKSPYFEYMSLEAKKLIIGRLYVLICDKKTRNDHNTISLRILIDAITMYNGIEFIEKFRPDFNKIDQELKIVEENSKLREFRDKVFAHTDLTITNKLIPTSYFEISNKTISDLFNVASKSCETIRLYLSDTSTDQMHDPITNLSSRLWECYEKVGLIKNLNS